MAHTQRLLYFWVLFGILMAAHVPLPKGYAQSQLVLGQRVRVSVRASPAASGGRIAGVLSAWSADSLSLEKDGRKVDFARSAVEHLEVSRGKTRMTRKGMVIGMIAGALVFGGAEAASPSESECDPMAICPIDPSPAANVVLGAIGGAAVGAGLGSLVGYNLKTDRWQHLPLEVSVAVVNQGARALGASPTIALRWGL